MIIESLHIRSFGKLENVDVTFDPKMNIIEGANESGKSTLAAFIRYMLYGFPPQRGQGEGATERRRRVNWNQRSGVAGNMTVRSGNRRYRIERTTAMIASGSHESFRDGCEIFDANTGVLIASGKDPGDLLLGVPETVFVNTAFIGQVGGPAVGAGELNAAIENLLFSGDERLNTKKAQDRLDDAARALLHKNGHGGEIFELRNQLEDVKQRYEEAVKDNAEIVARESRVSEITVMKERAAAESRRLDEVRKICHASRILNEFDQLHQVEKDFRAARDTRVAFEGKEGYGDFFPDHAYASELSSYQTRIEDARRADTECRLRAEEAEGACRMEEPMEDFRRKIDHVGGSDAALECEETLAKAPQKNRRAGRVLLSFGLLGAIASLVLWYMKFLHGPYTIAAFAASGVLALVGLIRLATAGSAARAHAAFLASLDVRDRQELVDRTTRLDAYLRANAAAREAYTRAFESQKAASRRLNDTMNAFYALLDRWGCTVPDGMDAADAADRLYHHAADVIERRSTLYTQERSLENTVQALRSQLTDYSEDEYRRLATDEARRRVANVNLDEAEEKYTYYTNQIGELDALLRAIEKELYELRGRAGNPAALATQIDDIEERITRLDERYRAYVMASEALSGAGDRLRDGISPRLSADASALISTATGEKYEHLGVSGDLDVTFTGEGGTKPISYLSVGTQDLTYVALRIALVRALYRELPPLCFDETFAHLDNERARALMRAICLADERDHQDLIFTCHDREATFAKEVLADANIIRMEELQKTE